MVNSLDLTTLITQIPEAQRVHHALLAHPELQQALAQQQQLKRQQAEKKQIARSEPTSKDPAVDKDAEHKHGHGFARENHLPADEADEHLADLPDQGQIIDMQV
ncbi:MAG: hypothetical protein GX055_05460 [Desulfovibrionales bacterium]|nr:hypothetical protein [Desulfovibrionales bacterium]